VSISVEGINQLILSGEVVSEPKTRTSPAGISITRFTLAHQSIQQEAGNDKRVDCRIVIVACGNAFHRSISKGMPVEVQGFLSYESREKLETRLVLHAQNIKELKHQD